MLKRSVMCRSGHECVSLEHPSQLQACCASTCLTTASVVRMVGPHCQMLKPYQTAALAYFASLMQRSIRSCVLALEAGLGGHAIVRPVLEMMCMKCSRVQLKLTPGPSFLNSIVKKQPTSAHLNVPQGVFEPAFLQTYEVVQSLS